MPYYNLAPQAISGHVATRATWAARGPESRQAAPTNQEPTALHPRSNMLWQCSDTRNYFKFLRFRFTVFLSHGYR
jgi:hypothetical protein